MVDEIGFKLICMQVGKDIEVGSDEESANGTPFAAALLHTVMFCLQHYALCNDVWLSTTKSSLTQLHTNSVFASNPVIAAFSPIGARINSLSHLLSYSLM